MRAQNIQLESQIIRGNTGGDSVYSEKISALEQKLLVQQEELTELHRRRGENAQMIIDLNAKLQLTEQTLTSKNNRSVNVYLIIQVLNINWLLNYLSVINFIIKQNNSYNNMVMV